MSEQQGGTATEKFSVFIRGSAQAVWDEITKTSEPQQAFFGSVMDVSGKAAGASFAMRSPNKKYTAVVGEVLVFDPPRRFSHTMKFTSYDDPHCTVTYDIADKDGGVEFTLTITDMPLGTKTAKSMKQGGPMICNTLKSIIETGRPGFGARMMLLMIRLMTPFTPKKCLTSNWS